MAIHSYLVCVYEICKASPQNFTSDGKRKIEMSNEDCSRSYKLLSQGAVILATHVSPRCENHILQHDGER